MPEVDPYWPSMLPSASSRQRRDTSRLEASSSCRSWWTWKLRVAGGGGWVRGGRREGGGRRLRVKGTSGAREDGDDRPALAGTNVNRQRGSLAERRSNAQKTIRRLFAVIAHPPRSFDHPPLKHQPCSKQKNRQKI